MVSEALIRFYLSEGHGYFVPGTLYTDFASRRVGSCSTQFIMWTSVGWFELFFPPGKMQRCPPELWQDCLRDDFVLDQRKTLRGTSGGFCH